MNSVYSFSDITMVISHPAVGQCTITGQGVGSITIARTNDLTQHDIAADGSVMVSKIITHNGTIAMSLQQTSEANNWIKKMVSYMTTAPTNDWVAASAIVSNHNTGETITINGISPQKRPDETFQNSGQQVTWTMMATEIIG